MADFPFEEAGFIELELGDAMESNQITSRNEQKKSEEKNREASRNF